MNKSLASARLPPICVSTSRLKITTASSVGTAAASLALATTPCYTFTHFAHSVTSRHIASSMSLRYCDVT